MVEGLASAQAKGGLTLLGKAGGEVAHALARGNAVGVLLVEEFDVGLGGVGELVADQQPARPALDNGVVAEVVAHLAVVSDGADTAVDLDG